MSHQQIGALFTVKIDENNTIVVASVTEPKLSYLSGWRITHVKWKRFAEDERWRVKLSIFRPHTAFICRIIFPPQQENTTSANVFVTFEQNLRKVDKKKGGKIYYSA